ncbi:hypothetical protein AAMO2058_000220400 [Amorphochlora amoebiformis]
MSALTILGFTFTTRIVCNSPLYDLRARREAIQPTSKRETTTSPSLLPFSQVFSQAFCSDRSPPRHTPSGWRPSRGSMVNMHMHTPFNVHGFEEIRPTTSILVCDETPGHCPPMPANLLQSPESYALRAYKSPMSRLSEPHVTT